MNILKTTIATLAVAVTVGVPIAEARQSTTNLSCRQVKNIVHSRGAIVMNTGRNTYDRFVVNRTFCSAGDYTKRAYVPTRDRNSCFIGYTCTMDNPREHWGYRD